ncbi:MAG TPA: hypothetical protein VFE65_04575 [Pseudonocardia sp.]|jgi:hypothetical protein|nr:hypothetical protein [Pseudonocardia sp.]
MCARSPDPVPARDHDLGAVEFNQAVGVAIHALDLPSGQAQAWLRTEAVACGRPLGDVCAEVVSRRAEVTPRGLVFRAGSRESTDTGADTAARPTDPAVLSEIRSAVAASGLTDEEIWTGYLAMGGTLRAGQLTEALSGQRQLSRAQHNRLAAALNEHFFDEGQRDPVPYR